LRVHSVKVGILLKADFQNVMSSCLSQIEKAHNPG
jgi:hypothetical protein